MIETASSLARKVRRLEAKNEELKAEADLYAMMAHDLAAPAIVEHIKRAFPEIARKWGAA